MKNKKPQHPLDRAFKLATPALFAVGFFSLCINLLMLTSPLYMLQIYDRVLVSRSVDTLVLLSIVALGALIVFGILEAVRARVLVRVGARFDVGLADTVFAAVMQRRSGAQPFRDLENIRTFLTGRSLTALFDAPWTPIYIALVYFLHPWLGHVALAGTLILLLIVVVNESATRQPFKKSANEIARANQFAESSSRNCDSVQAMGMLQGLTQVWHNWHNVGLSFQAIASDRGAVVAGAAKFIRVSMQVAILGVGAYLAINEIISPGVMIAASIITGRALAPIEAAISGWRSFLQARQARLSLYDHLDMDFREDEPIQLPDPLGELAFDNVYVSPPDSQRPILSALNFRLNPGTSIGLTGPSAAGKSTLARVMVGVWLPMSGDVRLDGAEMSQWSRSVLGPHIGYLSQDVELFPGTVAQNIARFGELDAELVMDAAKLAGAHETIVQLDEGYETNIGSDGVNLSGGQRQRIGLARAFFGRPSLIVLDEPTSNLDAIGEASVIAAVDELKTSGCTVVIIAHRPSIVGGVDTMMVLKKGRITHFGATAEIMPQIVRSPVSTVSSDEVSV